MIPKLLEAKILAAVQSAVATANTTAPAGVAYFGAWQPSLAGFVKNQDTPAAPATFYVGVGTMSRGTYSTPTASYSATIALSVRVECDPTGDLLVSLASPVEALLATWQGEFYQQGYTALDVDGFSVGDVNVQGGGVPRVDFNSKTVTVDWPLVISGTETPPTPSTTTT